MPMISSGTAAAATSASSVIATTSSMTVNPRSAAAWRRDLISSHRDTGGQSFDADGVGLSGAYDVEGAGQRRTAGIEVGTGARDRAGRCLPGHRSRRRRKADVVERDRAVL